MILISSIITDTTTDSVIEWLNYLDKNVEILRINQGDDYSIYFNDGKIFISHDNIEYDFNKFKSYWFRRGLIEFKHNSNNRFDMLRKDEDKIINQLLHYHFSNKIHINDYYCSVVNKLIVNLMAENIGLNTPKSLIVQNLNDPAIASHKKYITKSILDSSTFVFDSKIGIVYTNELKELESYHEQNFYPSLIQESIEKVYEIRTFYLKGKFWSMAIFSQDDEKTRIDFRRYNKETPNRNIPHKLPIKIEKQLNKLMIKLNLDCSSIDLIFDGNNYYFLEVNPIGQFGMVSYPCNYQLEKIVANYLLGNDIN